MFGKRTTLCVIVYTYARIQRKKLNIILLKRQVAQCWRSESAVVRRVCESTSGRRSATARYRGSLLRHPVYNELSPRGRRDDMPPPQMAVRLAADLRPSADGSAVRISLVAGQLQAASVPIA